MEPGEYLTNVLSSNEYASIKYEYFEPSNLSSSSIRKQLQKVEAVWRQEGKLLHCDPYRDGLWVFERSANSGSDHQPKEDELLSPGVVEVHGVLVVRRDQGIYEPASLARSKLVNALNTPTSSASPSSSLENALRNTQSFNARSAQANSLLNVAQEPPTPSPGTRSEQSPLQKDIHEYFISATLSTITYLLCRQHGLIPLNSRTLIVDTPNKPHLSTRSRTSRSIELATLDISLTLLGSLVVKVVTDPAPGLRTLKSPASLQDGVDKIAPGAALWLAPSGNAARFYSLADEERFPSSLSIARLQASPGRERTNIFHSLSVKAWQSRCLEWLSCKGLDRGMLEDGGWIFVQIYGGHTPYSNSEYQNIPMLEDLTLVPWPARLCFQTSGQDDEEINTFETSDSSRDPLLFVEEWFKGKEQRASISLKRQKERQIADALSQEQAALDARAIHSHTFSPTALRRGSNAGAMYPTPPDAPQLVVGATPTFDGNATTPGHQNFHAQADIPLVGQSHIMTDPDVEMWSSGKKEQAISSTHYTEHEAETDNMFGDMGGDGDLFGTDITDADFNFFDEPDVDDFDPKQAVSTPVVSSAPDEMLSLDDKTIQADPSSNTFLQTDISPNQFSPAPLLDPHSHSDTVMEDLDQPLVHQSPKGTDDENLNNSSTLAIKAPFNRDTIFELLTKANEKKTPADQSRRASQFDRVDFETSLQAVSEKYNTHGPFSVKTARRRPRTDFSQLPQTVYLNRKRKNQDHGTNMDHIARILTENASVNQSELDEPMDYLVDADFASPASEQDDSSNTTDNPFHPPNFGTKRKWEETDGDDMTSSFDAMAMEVERSISTPQSLNGAQLPLLDTDPADWSLTSYFTSVEPAGQSTFLSDQDRIATAQILADQAVSGTLGFPGITGCELIHHKASNTRRLLQKLLKTTKNCLKELSPCTMRALIDIQGLPALVQGIRLASCPMPNTQRPNNIDTMRQQSPFPLPPPQLELRRAESKLSILPAAVSFWENLGLGPAKGAKDVNAVCLWPDFDGVYANASTFLDQIRSVYESSRLGNHDRVMTRDLHDGLLSYTTSQFQSESQQFTSMKDTAGHLSKILSSLAVDEKNLVVYFVYPPKNKTILVHICSAFQHLFNLYRKYLSEKKIMASNELVLQLIPLDFISSSTSIVVPLPTEYLCLALEVYDRCVDFASSSSAPAIMLEQPLPRSIDFKLNPNPSASVLQENTCLHVSYAQSIDDRWITAAWIDNRGTQQMTASYCLGRKNEPLSMAFSIVANEIWETTLGYISSKKIHWRIIIARVGVMDPSEIDLWTSLASTASNAQVNLTLVTVQTEPSLRLLPALINIGVNGNSTNSVVTPVSTPQPFQSSVMSPDNAATPARESSSSATAPEGQAEPDGDARLIDYTDQSWGVVLSHRLNNSNSLMELNLALISGYLVKRGGSNIDDPPIVMEVNIVYSEVLGNPRTFHESLLREILGYYRGLGTLARVRGMVDSVRDVRPWHIAAAEKAVKALYMLM